jgi:hypothetical protein
MSLNRIRNADRPKTSGSHPLLVNPVEITGYPNAIGLTFCPGKKHEGFYSGTWDRDLDSDLNEIRKFSAKALVTLMETAELTSVHVPRSLLRTKASEFGLEWHHLPIRDVGVPSPKVREEMWTPVTSLAQGRAYALGWGTYSYRNMRVLAHSGDQQGATATIKTATLDWLFRQ